MYIIHSLLQSLKNNFSLGIYIYGYIIYIRSLPEKGGKNNTTKYRGEEKYSKVKYQQFWGTYWRF